MNVEQKSKREPFLKLGANKKSVNNSVNLISCLNLFIEMKNKRYSWDKIKETLKDELMKKGLLTDQEYFSDSY